MFLNSTPGSAVLHSSQYRPVVTQLPEESLTDALTPGNANIDEPEVDQEVLWRNPLPWTPMPNARMCERTSGICVNLSYELSPCHTRKKSSGGENSWSSE